MLTPLDQCTYLLQSHALKTGFKKTGLRALREETVKHRVHSIFWSLDHQKPWSNRLNIQRLWPDEKRSETGWRAKPDPKKHKKRWDYRWPPPGKNFLQLEVLESFDAQFPGALQPPNLIAEESVKIIRNVSKVEVDLVAVSGLQVCLHDLEVVASRDGVGKRCRPGFS